VRVLNVRHRYRGVVDSEVDRGVYSDGPVLPLVGQFDETVAL